MLLLGFFWVSFRLWVLMEDLEKYFGVVGVRLGWAFCGLVRSFVIFLVIVMLGLDVRFELVN